MITGEKTPWSAVKHVGGVAWQKLKLVWSRALLWASRAGTAGGHSACPGPPPL